MEENIMLQRINLAISKFRVWIFTVAALYKFTFWIIDMVNSFKYGGGSGVYAMFNGLFGMLVMLAELAILLEVSRKIAEKYTQTDFAAPAAPKLNYNSYNAPPQAPVPPQMQAPIPPQQAAPVPHQAPTPPQASTPQQAPVLPQVPTPPQPAPAPQPASVWFCSSCGSQNESDAMFCAKCGKPK